MKVSDFNYNLPEELIAQVPIEKRDESRLMVLDRQKQTIEHKKIQRHNRLFRTRRLSSKKLNKSYTSKNLWKKRDRSKC